MKSKRLKKRWNASLGGYDLYAVDASVVRSLARPDEEFDNFATLDEFPELIGKDEIWLAEKRSIARVCSSSPTP